MKKIYVLINIACLLCGLFFLGLGLKNLIEIGPAIYQKISALFNKEKLPMPETPYSSTRQAILQQLKHQNSPIHIYFIENGKVIEYWTAKSIINRTNNLIFLTDDEEIIEWSGKYLCSTGSLKW